MTEDTARLRVPVLPRGDFLRLLFESIVMEGSALALVAAAYYRGYKDAALSLWVWLAVTLFLAGYLYLEVQTYRLD